MDWATCSVPRGSVFSYVLKEPVKSKRGPRTYHQRRVPRLVNPALIDIYGTFRLFTHRFDSFLWTLIDVNYIALSLLFLCCHKRHHLLSINKQQQCVMMVIVEMKGIKTCAVYLSVIIAIF